MKYLGSFSIPCVIGNTIIDRALCDLGVSISLMPLSICKILDLGEVKPTNMSLHLANRFIKYPLGLLEDVHIRIGQFYIPTDFVVMDIEEDSHIPILLGKPFLATDGTILDVKKGKLNFEAGDEKINFILSKIMKNPSIGDSCCKIYITDEYVRYSSLEHFPKDELEACLIRRYNLKNDEANSYENLLDKIGMIKTNASNFSQDTLQALKIQS